MNIGQRLLASIGRICISLIFIIIGIASILNWQVAEVDVTHTVTLWQGYMGKRDGMESLFSSLLAMVPLFMGIGATLQILGGILLFLGLQVRLAAFLLLLYLVPITLFYHHFWLLKGHEQSLELIAFLKNLAIIGGLIVVLAMGKGQKKTASLVQLNDV